MEHGSGMSRDESRGSSGCDFGLAVSDESTASDLKNDTPAHNGSRCDTDCPTAARDRTVGDMSVMIAA